MKHNDDIFDMLTVWLARDEDGSLYMYNRKPLLYGGATDRIHKPGYYEGGPDEQMDIRIDDSAYPEVTWEGGPVEAYVRALYDEPKPQKPVKDCNVYHTCTGVSKGGDDGVIGTLTEIIKYARSLTGDNVYHVGPDIECAALKCLKRLDRKKYTEVSE